MSSLPAFRILLIEDNEADVFLVREKLAEIVDGTIELDHAGTIEQAEEAARRQAYDCFIADLNLPTSVGMETLSRIWTFNHNTPVIVLSGTSTDAAIRSRAEEDGATYVLAKDDPHWSVLARSVSKVLKGSSVEHQNQRFVDLVAAIPDAVLVIDTNGVVQFMNAASRDLFGRGREDLVGERIGFAIGAGKVSEIQVLRGNERRTAELRVVECSWGRRPAYLALIRDVTESKRLNEQLRQAQKMEAIGLLAGSIAHDFNNLLLVMMLYADVIKHKVGADSGRILPEIGEIIDAIQRSQTLTRQLLAFSRHQPADTKTLRVTDVIAGFHSLLRRLMPPNIDIFRAVEGDTWLVNADRGHIEQVLMNLAINARDAMPNGGRFTIRVENQTHTTPGLAVTPGDYLAIVVSDTGVGMTPDVMGRIFEPFFTTKDRGRGTGLGLATCYGIVAQAGGHILVDSTPGVGTTFTILLPRSTSPEAREEDDEAVEGEAHAGHECILLVDDDQAVARAARTILGSAGYTVTVASSGAQARQILEITPDAFDLVLTDVVMPQLSGPELAEFIGGFRPSLPVVMMTGYSDHQIVREGADHRIVGRRVLLKPFSRGDLLKIVRETLDRRTRG